MQRQNAEARGQHDERLGQLCKVRASFPAAMEYGPDYLAVLRGDTVHSRGEEDEWSLVVRRRDHASGWVPTSYLAPMEQEPERLEPAPVLEGTRTIRPGTTAHSLDHFLDIAEFNLWCRPKCLPMIAGEEVVVGLPIDPTGEWCFAKRAHNDEAGWVPRRFLEPGESRGGRRLALMCYCVLVADAAWIPGQHEAGILARVQIMLNDDPPTELARATSQLHVRVGTAREGKRLGVQLAMNTLLNSELRSRLKVWETAHQCVLTPITTRIHHDCLTLNDTDMVIHGGLIDEFVQKLTVHYPHMRFQWHPTARSDPWFREIAEGARAVITRIPLHNKPWWANRYGDRTADHVPAVYIVKSPAI